MSDLCSLDDVKGYLGLDAQGVTSQDALLTRLVSAASAWLEGEIGRVLGQTAITGETYSGDGTVYLRLRNGPVISVQSLTIDGAPVVQQTADVEGWVLQDDTLYLAGAASGVGMLITGPYGQAFSPTLLTTLRYTVGKANVVVSYTAGYPLDAIPGDLRQAAVELACDAYNRRSRLGVMSKVVGGESVTFQTLSLGPGIQGVIRHYQRVWL
jgi:hypothetical protein